MSILKLEFKDLQRPWHLKPVVFDDFNLLVGLSGVGKTRTLNVLAGLGMAASGEALGSLEGCAWSVSVRTMSGEEFTWTAKTGPATTTPAEEDEPNERELVFVEEQLSSTDGEVIAQRTTGGVTLRGQSFPRLRAKDSIIFLIDEDPVVQVRDALRAIHGSRAMEDWPAPPAKFVQQHLVEKATSLETLKAERAWDLLAKAYVLKLRFPKEWTVVQHQFTEIFDTVEVLDVGRQGDFDPSSGGSYLADLIVPALRERGVEGWVMADQISNGMSRSLLHLLEVHLEPPGSVLLIDEYENGMGVNCLPSVTDILLGRLGDVQLILTSHHPYVINNVPKHFWRIMRRKGHEVEILRKGDIPRLDTASELDSFIQLANAPEFAEGIS